MKTKTTAETHLYQKTPLILSHELSRLNSKSDLARNVYLKMDNCQTSGSFKLRGISNMILKTTQIQSIENVVTSSGGNAGLAAAYVCLKLKLNTTVVVPTTTSSKIVHQLEKYGAKVIIEGKVWNDANQKAIELTQSLDSVMYVPPFDHPLIWTGNSFIVDELIEQFNGLIPDCIILSVGGGGLACGVIEGLIRNGWIDENIKLILVETVGADCFNKSVKADEIVTLDEITSIAKTLGAKRCAEQLFHYYKTYSNKIESVVVTDRDAVQAMCKFLDDHKVLVEPSCGASLAVAYNLDTFLGNKYTNVLVEVCGGTGVDLEDLLILKKQFDI